MPHPTSDIHECVDEIYRSESRRVLATLIRVLGDFDLAEEAMHDAFTAAVEQWLHDGVPDNPRAWLISTGRFKAIDTLRRRKRFDVSLPEIAQRQIESANGKGTGPSLTAADDFDDPTTDDRLRLIFTCCHPALSPETQIALTLREVCGLKTEEIAIAFLTSPATIAQRIVRGKAKIRDAKIPYQAPSAAELPERLDSVFAVVYLVFNEGYSASAGESVTRADLSAEAIRLSRLLVELLDRGHDADEARGLLALMLFHESRRLTRTSSSGDLILLEDQNRSLWDRQQIVEAHAIVARALESPQSGAYTIQAAIAAVHASAATPADTDWGHVVVLYDLLNRAEQSPVVELNRAVAVAMRDGPQAGLELIDAILGRGELEDYHLAHAARADLCRRLGRTAEARESYLRALELARQEPERRFLRRRLEELA